MEYPGNSQNKRTPPEVRVEPKVVEPVVTGTVTRKKPNVGKRIKGVLFGGDVDSVVGFVLYDILIPAVKDTLSDIVSGGIERALYGEGRGGPSRRGRSSGHATGFVNYGASSRGGDRYGNEPRRISQGARIAQSFDEIILETRVEAETVIERLSDLCDSYGQVTVADLYDLCRIASSDRDFTDRKYGWYDMRGVSISRARGGLYMLDLPKPVELK
jgi:hypothetical protein